jgi:3' terminal RNA ribose 2'-O-methyltransferase Hen1
LLAQRSVERIVATDVSARALQIAARKLRLDQMPDAQRERLELFQSSLTYRDERLAGLDAAVLMEVIEHVDLPRLDALERTVFGYAAPRAVIVTTPNSEYNVRFPFLPPGTMRHRDHRFEWTRDDFRGWAGRVAATYGYSVRHLPVGPDDPEVGPPTQLALFTKAAA